MTSTDDAGGNDAYSACTQLHVLILSTWDELLLRRSSIHPWLAEIRAPVGSQEVAEHTHEWLLLSVLDPLILLVGTQPALT